MVKTKNLEEDQKFDLLSLLNPKEEARAGFDTTLKLIISALTLVSALAWNEAIKEIFEYFKQFLPETSQFIGPIIYAITVTLLTVFLINRLKRFQRKKDDKKKK